MIAGLKLVPEHFLVCITIDVDGASFELYEVDDGEKGYELRGAVESTPPDLDVFARSVDEMLHERFDPNFDACKWKPRG